MIQISLKNSKFKSCAINSRSSKIFRFYIMLIGAKIKKKMSTCIRKQASVCPPFPQQHIRLLSHRAYIQQCVYKNVYTATERRIECVTRATISRHASHNFRGRPVISSLPICRTYYPVIMPMPSIRTNAVLDKEEITR